MRPANTENLCCAFAYCELFVYGINREITGWKMTRQEECQGRGNDLLPFPIPVDLICRTFTTTHCEKLRLNFRLFPQDKMHYQLWVVWKGFTPDVYFVSLCLYNVCFFIRSQTAAWQSRKNQKNHTSPQCFHGLSCTGSSSMRKMLFDPFAASSSSSSSRTREKKVG